MTLKELQLEIAEALNGDEALAQGGCRAFAEDSHDVEQEVETKLHESGGVALVVLTPQGERAGGTPGSEIHIDLPRLTVAAVEIPALNRLDPAHLTALQAAQRAAFVLDSPEIEFLSFSQRADEGGTLTVDAAFQTQIELTQN